MTDSFPRAKPNSAKKAEQRLCSCPTMDRNDKRAGVDEKTCRLTTPNLLPPTHKRLRR